MGVEERLSFDGVEGLRAGKWGNKVNTACILYRIGDTLVDTGPPNQWRKVRAFIRERQVQQLLITHHHEDHGGNGRHIQALSNPQIYCHSDGLKRHQHGFHLPLYRRLVWGKPTRFSPDAVPEQIEGQDGLLLRPIHTPGHAPDMVCYLEPNRGWLFTGDLYVASKPRFLRKVEDPTMEIESLKSVLEQPFETVFCSHRGILEKGRQAVQSKLEYLSDLRGQTLALHQKGYDVGAIRDQLLGKETFFSLFSLGDFSKRNFIEAFLLGCALEEES